MQDFVNGIAGLNGFFQDSALFQQVGPARQAYLVGFVLKYIAQLKIEKVLEAVQAVAQFPGFQTGQLQRAPGFGVRAAQQAVVFGQDPFGAVVELDHLERVGLAEYQAFGDSGHGGD